MRWIAPAIVAGFSIVAAASESTPSQPVYDWRLPAGFRAPDVPADNPMSEAKVELGRHLFYDVRLSGNGTQSCASCHQQEKAFTDGRAFSVGSTGEAHPRGSMSLVNIGYARILTWANSHLTSLEEQARVPMFGGEPVELGLDVSGRWLRHLREDPIYRRLFAAAFPAEGEAFTLDHVLAAIACFERAIVSV